MPDTLSLSLQEKSAALAAQQLAVIERRPRSSAIVPDSRSHLLRQFQEQRMVSDSNGCRRQVRIGRKRVVLHHQLFGVV
jgi:hypothetical protein